MILVLQKIDSLTKPINTSRIYRYVIKSVRAGKSFRSY